ncbi:MAG TPA: cytochrome b, partial [Actinomycetota bacterium]|nr:cytochrome b [Actinomycetota bacterium]
YLGWLEGALRLFPPVAFELFDRLIAEPFVPGVVLPGTFFTAMFLWPFIERRITGDTETHHVLDYPRDAPMRTAVGVGALAFTAILTLAGSNDVLGAFFGVPVETVTRVLRVLVLLLPLVAAFFAYRLCRSLRDRGVHPLSDPERVRLRQDARGGFREDHA